MKNLFKVLIISLLIIPNFALADLAQNNSGMILLQVEENGEAWYVYPKNLKRYYLGRPSDAFQVMRELGLGIKHEELDNYLKSSFPDKLSGYIMLDVEANGEAYYVYPKDMKGYYLGKPADAFQVMRELGLGITNDNLANIPVPNDSEKLNYVLDVDKKEGDTSQEVQDIEKVVVEEDVVNGDNYSEIEKQVFDVVNEHRKSIGVSQLVWNNDIADIVRQHSENMARGVVELGHEGFDDRIDSIKLKLTNYNGGAENIAFVLNYSEPAQSALDSWLNSPSHKSNLENDTYDLSGIGVVKASDGSYYMTQIFINVD